MSIRCGACATHFPNSHLVVQDIFLTETANYADVILPASAFAEKTGTVTNTNRRFNGRLAVTPPGEAKEDWWIEVELATVLVLSGTTKAPRIWLR